jgi:hypothetical protein
VNQPTPKNWLERILWMGAEVELPFTYCNLLQLKEGVESGPPSLIQETRPDKPRVLEKDRQNPQGNPCWSPQCVSNFTGVWISQRNHSYRTTP